MRCDTCGNEAVCFQPYSGRYLCGRHLISDIETRAKRTIRSHRWLRPGDHIAVPLAGDRRSAALLFFLRDLTGRRRDIHLIAILPPAEEITDGQREAARTVAESLRLSCREILDSGVTRIAIPVSLDDVSQGVLGEFLFGDVDRLVNPRQPGSDRLPIICPFISVPSAEIDLYWDLKGTAVALPAPGRAGNILPRETRDLFEDYCRRHPATKHAILSLADELAQGDVTGIGCRRTGREVTGDGI